MPHDENQSMLRLFERKTWVSVTIAFALLVLAVAVLVNLRGRMPDLKPLPARSSSPIVFSHATEEQAWQTLDSSLQVQLPTNVINPFFTLHFRPPPPPPTKKVTLKYQGCFMSSKGVGRAYILVDTSLLILTNGARVVADHAISEIGITNLILTNSTGATNVLKFRTPTVLEVPAS